MAKYRVALIGCGNMGREHARAYIAHPDTNLVAAADPNPENLMVLGERFGIPPEHRYSDYRDLLAHESTDILGVVTPVKVTPKAVLAGVEAKVKAIFAEKPISASLAEADEMVRRCRESGIPFACGAIWRNHPYIRTAARLIHQEGYLGRVHSINIFGTSGEISGGGCHPLSVARLLANAEVDWVIGWMRDDAFSEDDQGAGGYLHFDNGVDCFLHMHAGPRTGIEVSAEWGVFFWDWADVYLWRTHDTWQRSHRNRDLKSVPFPYPQLNPPDIYPGITGGLQSLIDALEKGGEPHTSGDDMRKVLEIAIALRESARNGHVPAKLPIAERSLKIIPGSARWLGYRPIEATATKA